MHIFHHTTAMFTQVGSLVQKINNWKRGIQGNAGWKARISDRNVSSRGGPIRQNRGGTKIFFRTTEDPQFHKLNSSFIHCCDFLGAYRSRSLRDNKHTAMSQISLVAVPGQLLGSSSEYLPGPGTHIHSSNLYASILGPIKTVAPPKPSYPQKRATKITPAAPAPLSTISIERATLTGDKAEILPEVNSTVLCRVTRITPRQATVAILVVGETVLEGEWQGLIRVQDVRATEKDKVKIFESFRPGDIVRAVVVSFLLEV